MTAFRRHHRQRIIARRIGMAGFGVSDAQNRPWLLAQPNRLNKDRHLAVQVRVFCHRDTIDDPRITRRRERYDARREIAEALA